MKHYANFHNSKTVPEVTQALYECNEKSLPYFLTLAKNGDVIAQCIVGDYYHFSKLHDDVTAFTWYQRAALQGDPTAQFNMGVFYLKGFGSVQRNYTMALMYFRESAKLGNPGALNNLGVMRAMGWGSSQNLQDAKQYWYKAANKGNERAKRNLQLNKEYLYRRSDVPRKGSKKAQYIVRHQNDMPISSIEPVLGFRQDKILQTTWFANALYTNSFSDFVNSNNSFIEAFCYPRNNEGVGEDFYQHLHLRSIHSFTPLVLHSLISQALFILDSLPIYNYIQNFKDEVIPADKYGQIVQMIYNICGATVDEQGNMQLLPKANARELDDIVNTLYPNDSNNGFVQLKLRILLLHKIRCSIAHDNEVCNRDGQLNNPDNRQNIKLTKKNGEYFLSIGLVEHFSERNKANKPEFNISLNKFLELLKIYSDIGIDANKKDFKQLLVSISPQKDESQRHSLSNQDLARLADVSSTDTLRCEQLRSNIHAIVSAGMHCFNQQKIANKLATSMLPNQQNLTSYLLAQFNQIVDTINVLNKLEHNPNVLPHDAPTINDGEHGRSYLRILQLNTFFEVLSSKEFGLCCGDNNQLLSATNMHTMMPTLCKNENNEIYIGDHSDPNVIKKTKDILELKRHIRNSVTHCKYIFADNFKNVIFYDNITTEQNDPDQWHEICKISFNTMQRITNHLCNQLNEVDEHDYINHILQDKQSHTQTLAMDAVDENCMLADKYLGCSLSYKR